MLIYDDSVGCNRNACEICVKFVAKKRLLIRHNYAIWSANMIMILTSSQLSGVGILFSYVYINT